MAERVSVETEDEAEDQEESKTGPSQLEALALRR